MSSQTPPEQAPPAITIAAIDDHPMLLWGLGAALERLAPEIHLADAVQSLDELFAGPGAAADVVLLDLDLGEQTGNAADNVSALVRAGMNVLIFTSETRAVPLRQAVRAGAAGVLLKVDSPESILEAIRTVTGGGKACSSALAWALLQDERLIVALSPRELDVVQRWADGYARADIAAELFLTPGTVDDYTRRAINKYEAQGRAVSDRPALIREARRDGHVR